MGCGGSFSIDRTLDRLLVGRRLDRRAERVIFAMVANRALEPLSKLAASKWVRERAWIGGLDDLDEDACYRAMDWLLEIEDELAEQVYFATADLLNLEVDLLFFDTTSTYFERDEPESDVLGEDGEILRPAFRVHGHSKDHRPDLPQVVIGMAVTRTGIPIRVWCWPGNTNDQKLIRQVKDDLRSWKLGRVVWVADRGFQSAENRRYLQRAGGHYVLGEKLRGNSKETKAALSRQGRYHDRRRQPQSQGGRHRRRRHARPLRGLPQPRRGRPRPAGPPGTDRPTVRAIADSDRLTAPERAELVGELQAKRGLKRFLRTTKTGLLRVDQAAVAAEAHLDGKYLLRTSDPTLTAEDVALAYKQLLQVERGWREMKTTLDLRPVRHRREDRIRAHVILCWLALLLIRIAENQTGTPGSTSATSSSACTSARSPAPPAQASSAPSSPTANATSCAPSTCPSRHASWRSTLAAPATRPVAAP